MRRLAAAQMPWWQMASAQSLFSAQASLTFLSPASLQAPQIITAAASAGQPLMLTARLLYDGARLYQSSWSTQMMPMRSGVTPMVTTLKVAQVTGV